MTTAHDNRLTNSILKKWNDQGSFIRHVNGNTLDNRRENLQFVSLPEALEHIDDWKVDWMIYLTAEEINVVKDPAWRAGLTYKAKK